MTVYVVTEGSHSAYRIIEIYSTKEKAEMVKLYIHESLTKRQAMSLIKAMLSPKIGG